MKGQSAVRRMAWLDVQDARYNREASQSIPATALRSPHRQDPHCPGELFSHLEWQELAEQIRRKLIRPPPPLLGQQIHEP